MAVLFVNNSKCRYLPGETTETVITWRNDTGGVFTGSCRVTMLSHGRAVGAPVSIPLSGVAAGGLAYPIPAFTPPAIDFRGYLLKIEILNGASVVVDMAIGALDVSSDWKRFPRMAFLTNFAAGVSALPIIQTLNLYQINALQYYDIAKRHEDPLSTDASWPNLANTPVNRATLEGYIAAAASYRMLSFAYNLWNGGYSDYAGQVAGPRARLGVFDSPGLSQQTRHGPFPSDWAANYLVDFDPADGRWQGVFLARMKSWMDFYNFDGWQIDTLGDPGVKYIGTDKSGIDLGVALADFTRAAEAATGRLVVLNNVSRWKAQEIATRSATNVLYSETWGEARTYAALNAAVADYRRFSRAAVILPGYIHTAYPGEPPGYGDANYGSLTLKANRAGVRHLQSVMWSVGAYHLCFGDLNRIATNIFWPGPMIGMTDATRDDVIRHHAFGVGHQNLLRDGVVDAVEPASATKSGVVFGSGGAPGQVWLLPKTKAGFQILHLHNFSGLAKVDWKDVDADYPAPAVVTDIVVKMYYGGTAITGANKLFCASPDSNGGAPQELAYTAGSDGGGPYVTFTLPRLEYWTMAWLETNTLKAGSTDYEIVATQPILALDHHVSGGGLGGASAHVLDAGQGGFATFERVDFGAGVTQGLLYLRAPVATRAEMRLGGPEGRLLAAFDITAGAGFQTVSAPMALSGVHDFCVVFTGPPVADWQFVQFA